MTEQALTKARNAAYRFITYRTRSRKEVEEKLRDRGFDDAVVNVVIADLMRLGYLNDGEFARQWASGRARLRGFGRRRIEQELRNKGVTRDIVREALQAAFGEYAEEDVALREAEKRLRGLNRFEPDVRRRRIAGFLERRGFAAEIIRDILRTIR